MQLFRAFAFLRSGRCHPRRFRRRPQYNTVAACERLEDRLLLSANDLTFLEGSSYSSTQILVSFNDVESAEFGESQTALEGTKLGDVVSADSGLYEVYVDAGVSVEDAVAAWGAADNVAFAQPDYDVQLNLTPDDPKYGSLWGLSTIGAATAWNTTTGSSQIVVAVIDTGIDYTHPDLAANIWTNSDETPGNGLDDDGNGFVDDVRGWDFYNNDADPMDDHSHGSHVAGTIGAVGNNGVGVVGVNWNVKLMPLKFLGANGRGYTSDAIQAVDYARQNGADIINASWGGGGYSTALSDAIAGFHNAGGIFVAAAGNSSQNNDDYAFYPSNYDYVVSVAASDRYDNLASFSNYGVNTVDIAAPGVGILSTTPGNTYSSYSGTSMATPHVAGSMALVWANHPEWSNTQVVDQIYNTAENILTSSVRHGRLNLAAAIGSGGGGSTDTSGPRITAANWSGAQSGTLDRVRLTFDEAVDADSFDFTDVALSGPGGTPIGVQSVSPVGSSTTQFDVTFSAQSSPGTYQIVVGPDISDTSGNPMNQDGDATNGEDPQDTFTSTATISGTQTFSWTGSEAIRDRRTTRIKLDIAEDLTIDDVDVKVRIDHTWDSDLGVALIAPTGRGRWLIYRRGGSGDNIYATFDDEAATSIVDGAAPFDGTFRPETALSEFDGGSTLGTWQLYVRDYGRGDVGTIREFTMTVTPRAGAAGASLDAPASDAAGVGGPQQQPPAVVPIALAQSVDVSGGEPAGEHADDAPQIVLVPQGPPAVDFEADRFASPEITLSAPAAADVEAPQPEDLDAVFSGFAEDFGDILWTL